MTTVESSLEFMQPEQDDDIDIISSLPNTVLYHILSFLPTKTCVTTSVLSRRWRHLWQYVQVLDFSQNTDESYDDTGSLFNKFSIFVNNVLALRKARDVHKFRLECGHSHSTSIQANTIATLVRAAIGPHLEEFDLTLFAFDGRGFVMPRSLFSECENLESLSLCGGIHMRPQQASSVHLFSLKRMHLDIDCVECVDVILAGCPILENLYLSFASNQLVKVSVPLTLKEFTFAVENNVETMLEIHALGLKYLSITQCTIGRFTISIGNLYNVKKALLDMNVINEPVDTLIRLLTSICRAETLTLRHSTIKWLLRGPIQNLPNFSLLTRLELTFPWFNSDILLKLLDKCHALQCLEIQVDKEPLTLARSWTEPEIVPICLISHLKEFQFIGCQGFLTELEFVRYIIRESFVLKTMTIKVDPEMEIQIKYIALRVLFSVRRGSNGCHAYFG